MKYFRLLSMLFLCFSSISIAAKNSSEFFDEKISKVYVPQKDLLFHGNHMYLSNEGEYEELDAVYCDGDGLYIVVDQKVARTRGGQSIGEQIGGKYCDNGHPVYHSRSSGGCGGCANWWCPYRCKCNSPWNN